MLVAFLMYIVYILLVRQYIAIDFQINSFTNRLDFQNLVYKFEFIYLKISFAPFPETDIQLVKVFILNHYYLTERYILL